MGAFSLERGGKPLETDYDVPDWERALDERAAAGADAEEPSAAGAEETPSAEDGPSSGAEYEDAVALNARLKAMIAEAESSHKRLNGAQNVAQNGYPSGRSGACKQPRVPRMPGEIIKNPSSSSLLPTAESSVSINRRKEDNRVQKENAGFASRLAGSKSCILPPVSNLSQRPGGAAPQESSQSINRRKFDEKVQRENANMVNRIEQPSRARSFGPPRKCGESELPKGWTRGIGGRAMPPPKMRWATTKYDAGEMNFR